MNPVFYDFVRILLRLPLIRLSLQPLPLILTPVAYPLESNQTTIGVAVRAGPNNRGHGGERGLGQHGGPGRTQLGQHHHSTLQ